MSPDLLVADLAAYFGNYTSNFIVEGYEQLIGGQMPFGIQSLARASSRLIGPDGSIAIFQRIAGGNIRFDPVVVAPGARLQPASGFSRDGNGGRFTPAPVPNRLLGSGGRVRRNHVTAGETLRRRTAQRGTGRCCHTHWRRAAALIGFPSIGKLHYEKFRRIGRVWMRGMWLIMVMGLAGCGILNPAASAGLKQAGRNYPPLIIGANTMSVRGPTEFRACPVAGSRVEQKSGPTIDFLGAVAGKSNLSRMNVGGESIEGFDIKVDPHHTFHDLICNEGIERISLLGKTYTAIKLSHYCEGFDTNVYRSVATVWKDQPTGLLHYGTYQHTSGVPVVDDPMIPTAIVEAR